MKSLLLRTSTQVDDEEQNNHTLKGNRKANKSRSSICKLFIFKVTPLNTKKRKRTTPRRRSGLSKADMAALHVLDDILAWEREMEQRYNLPFRMPQRVETCFRQCAICQKDILYLIFADRASDIPGLEAYARLLAEPIRQANLPTYILGPPSGNGTLDEQPSLLLKVWPTLEPASTITPPQWDQLIEELSLAHCQVKNK